MKWMFVGSSRRRIMIACGLVAVVAIGVHAQDRHTAVRMNGSGSPEFVAVGVHEQDRQTTDNGQQGTKGVHEQDRQATDNGQRGTNLVLDLGGGITLELVPIPSGKFMMGSTPVEKGGEEKVSTGGAQYTFGKEAWDVPQHDVTISKSYYMGKFLVTQEQYEKVMGKNPSSFNGPKNPVDSVSWDDAVAFCRQISTQSGRTVRLPTEAEWEYACRAGTTTAYYFGNDSSKLGDYAWTGQNSEETTHPVGEKKPNAWGLFDMHGQLWEWCADWFDEEYYAKSTAVDPKGPETGEQRVLRGGASWFWMMPASWYRSASRMVNKSPDMVGFRVVVEASSKSP